jgi:glycerol-3-phosphate dehydrogenase
MTLAFVKSAAARGAVVANHVEAVRVQQEGARATGVAATDRLTGRAIEIAARLVVNAAGPWIGRLNATAGHARLEREITAFSKGVHIVTRPLLEGVAVAVPTRHRNQAMIQRGGRHFFVIPWRGRSLIGTTNVPFGGTPDAVGVSAGDVRTFVADINDALPGAQLAIEEVQFAFAGLYPLTEDVIRPEVYQGTGLYQLVDHAAAGGLGGFVSVLGAKYTTARRLAERAVDLALRKLGRAGMPCATRDTPLEGGAIADLDAFRRDAIARHARVLPPAVVEHLVGHYGTEIDAVVAEGATASASLEPLTEHQPTIEAEVRYAVGQEMACRLEDVVFRRTGLGTIGHPGRACLERCSTIVGDALGWDETRRAAEMAAVERRFTWST